MTALPAQTLGLYRRGTLQPGHYADLLIFDPQRVKARATFSEPHRPADGMDWVIVNGVVVFHNGKVSDRSGRMLRRKY